MRARLSSRNGFHRLDGANIRAAVDASLLRLRVERIDLLSLHWPDRYVPMFGDVAFEPAADYGDSEPAERQLEALEAELMRLRNDNQARGAAIASLQQELDEMLIATGTGEDTEIGRAHV